MSEKQSSFKFIGVRILRSNFNFGNFTPSDMVINISPQGLFERKSKEYTLVLDVRIADAMGTEFIAVASESKFQFEETFEDEIPNYFTLNAPAITFPYIRAYISSLSSLSGIGMLNLPILNLVDLVERLKTNYSVKD